MEVYFSTLSTKYLSKMINKLFPNGLITSDMEIIKLIINHIKNGKNKYKK